MARRHLPEVDPVDEEAAMAAWVEDARRRLREGEERDRLALERCGRHEG